MQPIVFYDIYSTDPKRKALSPNTWKTRFTLNYKKLPYNTEYVQHPDIEGVSKERGAAPIGVHYDGRPRYTVPMIYDPNTNMAVADSLQIAKYLDKTYPSTPTVVPEGTASFHAAIGDFLTQELQLPLLMVFSMDRIPMGERSIAYFKDLFADRRGNESQNQEQQWTKAETALGKLKTWLDANGPKKDMLLMGNRICFADFLVAAALVSFRLLCGEQSEEWKRVCGWQGGKWKTFLEQFEAYMQVADA